jgi:acetyl-CoA/propionyl-CoA carboxylase biotin carboxyl carrier protein
VFDTVLVANRGEIACRVIKTLRRMGIRAVAVHSDADATAPHVRLADVAVRIESYLAIPAVIDAARATGAQAVHPGYGFLSENTAFAAACEEAGIVFVGPPSSAIEAMGDKIRAKQTVAKAGVPVVPGSDGAGLDDAALSLAVEQVGYPVLLKPSAGGGGKGMREVHRADDLADAIASARREARGSFGDDTLLVERLIRNPRHIEIQVMADTHGNVIHLGERECSLQRRHQKIIEEAPSPLLTDEQREAMGAAAVEAARAVGYTGAGTVEFIVDGQDPDQWFFMEMNTRLQVEHPVTEEVYGADLVETQVRVAAGEAEPWGTPRRRGHAVEARIYAEDPAAGFLPTGGRILRLRWPEGVRVDAGVAEGGVVGSAYDPMLAKVIVWAPTRDEALRGLHAALGDTVLLGLDTNIGFLRALLADADVRAGRLDTGLVGRRLDALTATDVPPDVLPAAAVHALAELEPSGPVVDPFDVPGGWRVGAPAWTTWRMAVAGRDPVEVRARGRAADAVVEVRPPVTLRDAGPLAGVDAAQAAIADAPPTPGADPVATAHAGGAGPDAPGAAAVGGAAGLAGAGDGQVAAAAAGGEAAGARSGQAPPVRAGGRLDGDRLVVTVDGITRAYAVALDGDTLWLGRDGHAWAVHEQGPVDAVAAETTGAGGPVRSPMPGTVTLVEVADGQTVTAGDRLVVVEAMKMEHVLTAPVDGVVRDLRAKAGATVAKDAVLLTVETTDAEEQ